MSCWKCKTEKTEKGIIYCKPCIDAIKAGTTTSVFMEDNNLLLPRNYLSYSAMTKWIKNPEAFKKEYFMDGDKLDTKYLRFGKMIAKMIENGSCKELLPTLEVYSIPEHEIRVKVAGVPILSFLDSYEPSTHLFREVKTGKIAWTDSKVQKHEQLVFYATALKWSTGRMPEYCHLDWIETSEDAKDPSDFWQEVEKQLAVTGKIVSFKRVFDEREIERMEKLIVKSVVEISNAYREFIDSL